MGFQITLFKAKPGYFYDYLGLAWKVGTLAYFFYKVYNQHKFHAYDSVWLFTNVTLQIPKH